MSSADDLLNGPRGRRLCLECVALTDDAVSSAVFWLGQELDPHPGTLLRIGDFASAVLPDPSFTEEEVAELVLRADLTSVSEEAVREALCVTVDEARYWQAPDGSDALAALPLVRDALTMVAERSVSAISRLDAPFISTQWAVEWSAAADARPLDPRPTALLEKWSRQQREDEVRSARERPSDVRANWSGTWWSVPQELVETRADPMDSLQLVEDSLGWEVATVIPVHREGRVLEVASAENWADLCREYPMEVTASRRHDWFRVTGYDGRWLIPDWERVATRWDAIHLTTLGYLSAATSLIRIDDEYASVIAGWAPDSTIWLTDRVHESSEPRQQWRRREHANVWVRDHAESSQV